MLEKVFAAAYRWGDFVIVPAARQILRRGEPVEHEAKVLDLIVLLLEHHERALGKQEIITALWGDRPVTDAALSQLVYKARRALDDDARVVIRTVYGRGLQWAAPIEALDGFTPPAHPGGGPTRPAGMPEAAPAPTARTRRWRRGWLPWLASCGFLAGIAVVLALAWPDGAGGGLQPPQVAVMPIRNASGDDALEWTRLGLPALLTTELQRLGISGVDTPQVERLVAQAPAARREAGAHVREGSGARAVIDGQLRRVGTLLRLELRLDMRGQTMELSASGVAPAQLAVDLAGQLAGRLNPQAVAPEPSGDRNPWLAETYARGMDLATRNDWLAARPYFELCVQQDPAFAEARLDLARMQVRTGEERAAQENFRMLVDTGDAGAPDVLRARMELAMLAAHAGDREGAADALEALRDPAERTGIATLTAWIEMNLAAVRAELGQGAAADAAFARAETIIRAHGLRNYEPRLYNVASLIADSRHDPHAARKANERALAAATSLGDRQGALGAALNAAALDIADGHPLRALPLLVQSWRDAGALDAADERVFAGQTLAEAVLRLGAGDAAAPLLGVLRTLVQERGSRWIGVQQAIDGVVLRQAGQPAAALDALLAARGTLEAAGLAALLPAVIDEQALALWDLGDGAALATLAADVDGLAAAAVEPARLEFSAQVIAALAAARRGDVRTAHVHADSARRLAAVTHDAAIRELALAVRLRIAETEGGTAAGSVCREMDPATLENADLLQRCGTSVADDPEAAHAIQARIEVLREAAGKALAHIGMRAGE